MRPGLDVGALEATAARLHAANGHDDGADDYPHGLEIEWAHELGDVDEAPDDLVQGVITRGAMSVLYGDSHSGKTFAAISLASAISNGFRWLGREVEPGLVVYLATENPASVKTRMRAYMRHFGVRIEQLVIVKSPLNFFSNEADTDCVIKLIREIEVTTGRKVALVIGDTLARLCAGANEIRSDGVRILRQIQLHEVSLVTLPADASARISSVKAQAMDDDDLPQTLREYERFLHQCGFSKTRAAAIAKHGFSVDRPHGINPDADDALDLHSLGDQLAGFYKSLKGE